MAAIVTGGKAPLSLDRIQSLEERLGIRLPTAYKAFLLSSNGGRPYPFVFDYTGTDGRTNSSVVDRFLSINDDEQGDDSFELEYKYHAETGRIPRHVAPIGRDPGGNLICISMAPNDNGAIYFGTTNLNWRSLRIRIWLSYLAPYPNFFPRFAERGSEVKIVDSQKPITERDIADLEEQTGLRLPKTYRGFLLKQNGGTPEPSGFETKDGKVESLVATFLPLAPSLENNLLEEIEGITLAGQIPGNLIPIATTPAANRVVLSVKGADRGKVYYWAWDEEDDNNEPSYSFMRLISDSFTEFLESLH